MEQNVSSRQEDQPLLNNQASQQTSQSLTQRHVIQLCVGLFILLFYPVHEFLRNRDEERTVFHPEPNSLEKCQFESEENARFKKKSLRVPESIRGFPSFWNYEPFGPIHVSYDERAILLNGTRSLFLGGSLHPSRATHETWNLALDEAVRHGLNLVTIYVFWKDHQPFPNVSYNWSFPGNSVNSDTNWDLATAIREAANRGLFVHARIGPYVCAEYSYGGIPEWLALQKPTMSMRRPNKEWMEAMETYVKEVIQYLTKEQLWSHQGGPIIMGQIENELGDENHLDGDESITSGSRRNATMQDYADWCGDTAAKYAPQVLWTMCNGLTAPNAINTCNGYGGVSCSEDWLESYGQNGRIQVDQPALWTENEGGFQVWGEEPSHSSYFWGRTARDFARDSLKWFARGGTHLNYYMWWGGYNRQRSAAGGIMNMYASDAILCPSGQRRQPKYAHLQALHQTMIQLASVLLESPSALLKKQTVHIIGKGGKWEIGSKQQFYLYAIEEYIGQEQSQITEIVFVENDSDASIVARIELPKSGERTLKMEASSVIVLVNGAIAYDSSLVHPNAKAFRRVNTILPFDFDWKIFLEPRTIDVTNPKTKTSSFPMEQTKLMISSNTSSDYAWYETTFKISPTMKGMKDVDISIETEKASAMSVFVNKRYIDTKYDPHHEEGGITFTFRIGDLAPNEYKVSILSENFGYGNLIGRWGASTKEKVKGITGAVTLSGNCRKEGCGMSLLDGRSWLSLAGLQGSPNSKFHKYRKKKPSSNEVLPPGVWLYTLFETPSYNTSEESLFLDLTEGLGRIFLNSIDLGRYWNITRGKTAEHSQRYYFLPPDYLRSDGKMNKLVIFNSLGGNHTTIRLVLSGLYQDNSASLEDIVDYPNACI